MTTFTFTIVLPSNFAQALRGLEARTLSLPLQATGGIAAIESGIRSVLPPHGLLHPRQFAEVARQVLPGYRRGQRRFKVTLQV